MQKITPLLWFDNQAEEAVNKAGFQRVMRAVMQMKKLDIATLESAYEQRN